MRTIALVKSSILYCSSIYGERNVNVHQRQPMLPSNHPILVFSTDGSLLVGSPVLIQWYPVSPSGADGVMLMINIELLGELILNAKSPLITGIGLQVGGKSFINGLGLVDRDAIPGERIIYHQSSSQFPFTINVSGPGASAIALNDLPAELPLALILTLLMTGIAWLITAGRLSFSREISLGIASREFALWCQPLEDARSQSAVESRSCCAGTIRVAGNISPDVFIPIAEGYILSFPSPAT
nr:Rtn protein [Raoultella sp. NCTC 9187]